MVFDSAIKLTCENDCLVATFRKVREVTEESQQVRGNWIILWWWHWICPLMEIGMCQIMLQLYHPIVISHKRSAKHVEEEDRCVLHKIMLRNIANEEKTKKFITISSFLICCASEVSMLQLSFFLPRKWERGTQLNKRIDEKYCKLTAGTLNTVFPIKRLHIKALLSIISVHTLCSYVLQVVHGSLDKRQTGQLAR